MFVPHPEGGPATAKTVSGIGSVSARYEESTEFAEKSATKRKDYQYCAQVARDFKTEKGKGTRLDKLCVDRPSLPVIQAIIETIAKGRKESVPGSNDAILGRPSKANHLLRYSRAVRLGHAARLLQTDPAEGAKQVKERRRHGMPTRDAYDTVLNFARQRGALLAHTKGSCPPYLWSLLEIKYLFRMRSIEVVRLTEAHASDKGLYVARTKGSNDNIARWTPRLKGRLGRGAGGASAKRSRAQRIGADGFRFGPCSASSLSVSRARR